MKVFQFWYSHPNKNVVGLSFDEMDLLSATNSKQGTICSWRVRTSSTSPTDTNSFLPYIVHKIITTSSGVIAFEYLVDDNKPSIARITEKQGMFKRAVGVQRKILSSGPITKGIFIISIPDDDDSFINSWTFAS